MEDEEPRAQLAPNRFLRKVPGSFDEDDEISPVKDSFDHSVADDSTSNITNSAASAPPPDSQLRPENVPPLRPSFSAAVAPMESSMMDDDLSLFSDRHPDSLAEQAVRDHLQDFESSFVPPISPIPTIVANGVDDTYVFDSPRKEAATSPPAESQRAAAGRSISTSQPSNPPKPSSNTQQDAQPSTTPTLSPAPPLHAQSQQQQQSRTSGQDNTLPVPPSPEPSDAANMSTTSATTAELEGFSSSPAASAAARNVSRAIPSASAGSSDGGRDQDYDTDDRYSTTDEKRAGTKSSASAGANNESWGNLETNTPPGEPSALLTARDSLSADSATLRHRSSDTDFRKSLLDAGSTPGNALRYGKRPKYLRSRNASQRSSVSSFATNNSSHDDRDSDVTVGLGTDYALQSGGAVPAMGTSQGPNSFMSRSVSLGSISSELDYHDHDPDASSRRALDHHLETLDENAGDLGGYDDRLQQTPKAKGPVAAPTDTTIARRVKDVHVPEYLAKEYRSKSGLFTPRKPSGISISSNSPRQHGKPGVTMTLKEQSHTIERLSKENFDLKLKVMFLSDRLDKLSEEGVKEMISENVELKTSLAVLQRDNKVLRRRVKELEKQLKDEDERPSTARSGVSSNGQASDTADQEAQEKEEELVYLRERVEEYESEVERLRGENMSKEADRRKMAEHVKSLQTVGERHAGETLGRQEEADVWKDLLEQETARREQADDDNRKLRDEIFRLKQEMTTNLAGGGGGGGSGSGGGGTISGAPGHGGMMHHTTNIYNITKKPVRSMSPSRPVSAFSGELDGSNGLISVASTLVEDLRRDAEQLRHENAELRREVGAQTSMLTSRNREKERLYQEIEDLKLAQRRGGPAPSTIDSLLERSASRAGARERSASRASGGTRALSTVDDAEREEMEIKMAELRDKINEFKLRNQDLQQELNSCTEDFEAAMEGRKQAEEAALALQDDLDAALNDLMALQAERDEALQENDQLQTEFESLRKEAQEELDTLDHELEVKNGEMERLQQELGERTENFNALQEEMRKLSESLVGLEDEQDNKMRRIQTVEQQLAEANKELEELEAKLLESNDKAQRLSVQQESGQDEIAFLREEQEGDKIRIGDLEASLANAEQSLREEKDRAKELEQRLQTERRQREIVANREKESTQQVINELNRDMSAARDETRRLRKNLSSREVEATEWKERLMELENNLREALGDLNGTRSSLLKSIAKLQRQLEDTVRELDAAKASVMEKDRIIKQRDALLETHGLESRKLADMLEKERQAHRVSKHQFETFQKTHQHVTRTVSTQDVRISELEATKSQDKKRIAQLEATFREQLNERNNLLLSLWTRLSALCGSDWAHDNSLINGRALPSLEAVATMLPGFSKNLLAAVKTIETIVGGFQQRVRDVEKDLWREYHSLENNLEARAKKLDRLESVVRSGVAAGTLGVSAAERELQARMVRLEDAYRQLKVENATLRTANDVRARAAAASSSSSSADPGGLDPHVLGGGSPSPSIPTGPRDRSRKSGHRTSSAISSGGRSGTMVSRPMTAGELAFAGENESGAGGGGGVGDGGTDSKWILRLRDLENKLKVEREGRMQDRSSASQRILELESQNTSQARVNDRRRAEEARGR